MTHEIRQNKLTGQWVIFATERSQRPRDHQHTNSEQDEPEHDPDCPFCPGNEDKLEKIIMETMKDQHWQVRVVPNKFPMLMEDASHERDQRGIFLAMPGWGQHEVIVDHPVHNRNLADMTQDEVRRIIDTYYWRYITLLGQHDTMTVIIFRNYGTRAGASLAHPHSQLVVTGIVPPEIRLQDRRSQEYYDTWGRNLMVDILEQEIKDKARIVTENKAFVAFVPYAADVPYEVWIVPRRAHADFGDISSSEITQLAAILLDVVGRLRDKLDNPDYNYVIRSAPRYKADEPHLCWYLQIRPRLVTRAGFELGAGMRVNPTMPEDDATVLRD